MVGHKDWYKKADPLVGQPILGMDSAANPDIGPMLNDQYRIGASANSYNLLGGKMPIIGKGVTPFRHSLREVYSVNMPYQIGQRNNEPLIQSNQNSLLKTAGQTAGVTYTGNEPGGGYGN